MIAGSLWFMMIAP